MYETLCIMHLLILCITLTQLVVHLCCADTTIVLHVLVISNNEETRLSRVVSLFLLPIVRDNKLVDTMAHVIMLV